MSTENGCTMCELPVRDSGVTADGNEFCCAGCREVYDVLGEVETVDVEDVRAAGNKPDTASVPAHHEPTFLEVKGMYCVSCESFIQAVAGEVPGVSAVSASYVTDTVRIDHDPESVSTEELKAAISRLGYTAYDRTDSFSQRQADDWEEGRIIVGVLVGMMVMLQYLVIIYPTYFGGLVYDQRTYEFFTATLSSSLATPFYVVIGAMTTIVLVVTGKPVLQGAYVGIRTRTPNMDLLVAIAAVSAYLYSTLSIAVGGEHIYYDVTVAIIVVVSVGGYYESSLKRQATEQLSELTSVAVADANRLTGDSDGSVESVPVEQLEPGDRVLVRTGERIPIDGDVVDGEAAVDEAVVTGESLPTTKEPGAAVVGGSLVVDGALTIETGADSTSTLDRISELVWDLQSTTHGIQKLADQLATIFVPLVLVLAVVVTVAYLALGATISAALLVGLTVLIVSCPCALGLATPLAVAAGIRDALERSMVIFDDSVFERLRSADTVVFDKTGTLTTGEMSIIEGTVDGDLLAKAAALEQRSAHPVGKAIAAAVPATDGGVVAETEVETEAKPELDYDHEPDHVITFERFRNGVAGTVGGEAILVGHPDLFRDQGWELPSSVERQIEAQRAVGRNPVAVGREGTALGMLAIGDEPREGWEETVTRVSETGADVVVLTGDGDRAARQFRDHPAIDQVFAGVPPEGKAETVKRLQAGGLTVMVGDGTNDAPALAAADLGIALGGGTAMAADAADVALVDNDLSSVETVFDLAKAADRRVKGNIGWAFCYNGIAIPLAITGLLNPLFAALAMAISSLLVVTNSSRALLPARD